MYLMPTGICNTALFSAFINGNHFGVYLLKNLLWSPVGINITKDKELFIVSSHLRKTYNLTNIDDHFSTSYLAL
jgi:hypothetical protein